MENRIYAGMDLTTRKAERKMRFIDAGIKIIGTTGYRSATLRVLCNEAGLTERYFYESFGSTEMLFLEVLDHLILSVKTRLVALVQAHRAAMNNSLTVQDQSQTDLARLALTLYFTEVQNPLFGRITLIEVLGISPTVDQKYIQNTRQFAILVTQIIRAIEPNIRIDAQDEEIVGTALVGSIITTATGWMLQGYPYTTEQMVNNYLQVLTGTARQLLSPYTHHSTVTVANTATIKQASAI